MQRSNDLSGKRTGFSRAYFTVNSLVARWNMDGVQEGSAMSSMYEDLGSSGTLVGTGTVTGQSSLHMQKRN